MTGLGKEVSAFLQAVFAGNLVYLVYSMIRVFRRILKHNLFWVSVEDAVFWIVAGVYLFLTLYHASNGRIRWYFILGIFIGGILTHRVISKIIKKYIDKS